MQDKFAGHGYRFGSWRMLLLWSAHEYPYCWKMVRAPVQDKPQGLFGRVRARVGMSRRKLATVAAGVLALGVGYHVVFGRNGLIVYEQKRADAKTLDGELRSLERENEKLQGHVDRLQSDPDAIEQQAREGPHYVRPGELIYELPNAPTKK